MINKEYGDGENAFDRCMEVTKRSRDYFKEAMRREDYYRNSMLLMGVDELLTNGYLTIEDFKDCRPEIQEKVRQWLRLLQQFHGLHVSGQFQYGLFFQVLHFSQFTVTTVTWSQL